MTKVERWSREITALTSDRGDEHFFIFTTFSPSDDQNDIEKGVVNIKITDGGRFWRSKESVTAEDLAKSYGRGRIKPALEALTEKFPSTHEYTYSMDRRDNGNQILIISYSLEGVGLSKLRVQLFPMDAKAEIISTLDTLRVNLDRLKVARDQIRNKKLALEQEIATITKYKQEFAPNSREKGRVERTNYQGLATLLNLKKDQLRAAAGKLEEDGDAMDVEENEAMEVVIGQEGEEETVAGAAGEVQVVEASDEEETEISGEESKNIGAQSPDREYDNDW